MKRKEERKEFASDNKVYSPSATRNADTLFIRQKDF